jgi:RecA/RadA recombinase
MATRSPDLSAALVSLRTRWGAAAPAVVGEVVGALATVPLPAEDPAEAPFGAPFGTPFGTPFGAPAPGMLPAADERIVRTGFGALDAIIGPGGIPRDAAVALRGDASSGKTTLALRLAAEAQAAGSIVAWLDLGRSLDPVEAVARGVRLDWLVVLVPDSLDEGLAMAGALVAGGAVDVLLVDLPVARQGDRAPAAPVGRVAGPRASAAPTRPPSFADRLHRLVALARRHDVLLVVLEPPGLGSEAADAVAGSTGLRLELVRRAWIRLGRDVVGQRTEVTVARNRFGPPGRRAELRILYADGGPRDACLLRPPLLAEPRTDAPTHPRTTRIDQRATPPPPLAPPPAPARPAADDRRPELRLVPDRPAGPRRTPLDERDRPRREPGGRGARDPAGNAPRGRTPARARGDVPRPGA